MQWGDAMSASAFIPGAPHKYARAAVDTNKAVGTSATFDRVVEVKALIGGLLAIVGEAMHAIVISSFDPCPLVISKCDDGLVTELENSNLSVHAGANVDVVVMLKARVACTDGRLTC